MNCGRRLQTLGLWSPWDTWHVKPAILQSSRHQALAPFQRSPSHWPHLPVGKLGGHDLQAGAHFMPELGSQHTAHDGEDGRAGLSQRERGREEDSAFLFSQRTAGSSPLCPHRPPTGCAASGKSLRVSGNHPPCPPRADARSSRSGQQNLNRLIYSVPKAGCHLPVRARRRDRTHGSECPPP